MEEGLSELIAKFDTNGDGQLDIDEWQVQHDHMELNQEEFLPVNILSMDRMPKLKMFILSSKRETELIKVKSLMMKACLTKAVVFSCVRQTPFLASFPVTIATPICVKH